MAPRKKSAKKSNQNSNQSHQSSQPSKFGIQHFFERHSQNPKPIIPNSDPNPSTSGNPMIPCNLLKSHRNEGLDLGSESRSESNSANVDSKDVASGAVIRSGDEVHLRGKDEEAPSQDTPEENLIPVMGNAMENQLEESPEISKSVSVKRFKFSPGMLIKQSQDDGGEAVTWKISPVNERLHKVSKHLPDAIKVLADSSRVNMMSFQHCSQLKSSSGSVFKVDKWLSSPPMKTTVKSLTLSNGTHPEKVNSNQDMGNENAIDMNNHGMANSQSPFTTPPSLPYCHDKPTVGVDPNVESDQLGSRQHKKALLDLLDQVEDVISVEELTCKEKKVLLPRSHNRNGNDKHVKSDPSVKGAGKRPAKVSKESPNIFFLVLEVSEKQLVDSSGPRSPFKILRLLNEQSGEERVVQLFDEWYESVIAPGDTVHVVGDFDGLGMCDVNHDSNFIIVHPDILVSGTRVASSFTCPRRTVLDERLKSGEQSAAALIGTLLHQIFQAGLIRELPTKEFLEEYARVLLQKNIEGLYACGVNEGETHKTLMEAIPRLLSWIHLFRDSQGLRTPSVDFGSDHGVKMMEVSEVVDIEEMAWAPRYGLKGMIDASIRFKAVSNGSEVNNLIMPLEFKSGKATSGQTAIEHRAQVMLYTLLMSERYKKNIDSGLLYYLHTDQTQGVVVRRSDLVGLIMRRNELAKDILKASTTQRLPPMLRTPNMCRSCRHLNVCTIYHKAQGGSTETSGLGDMYDSLVNHLTDEHGVFLEKWDRLIDLEAKDLEAARKEIWSRSETRTSSTSCISSIVLDTSDKVSQRSFEQGNRFVYRFVRQDIPPPNEKTHDGVSLDSASSSIHELDSSVKTGDYVILSTESDHLAVASGVIMDISRFHVDVSFSKRLRLPRGNPSSGTQDLHQEVWRIDKDEFMASFAIMRFNLIQLFLQNEGSSHLRRMIVELEAPRYDNGCIFSQDPAVSYIWSQKNLNDDQRRAILKILTAKDYTLVLGMPGTGKTSTMVHAVKALLMRGASILLTSYTNSAVDNLLIKLKSQGVDFIRIGRYEAVHEEIRGHCISAMDMQSTEDIKLRLDQVKVVAVTCLGVMSPLLANKRFDVCIMDEAGQTTLPVSLGPLMFASMFVLVGDHYQLPPLVKSAEARENGMGVSLFCRLSEAHPQAISALQSQYRMCASIMELSNGLIYGNRLRCGSPEIENAKLMYTSSTSLTSWLKEVLDPDKPVIFINTDFLPAFEVKDGKSVSNPTEASIVSQVTDKLVQKGIRTEDIGIITPYNSQTNLIGQALSRSVEINTIDKYQGRDKDCILVSFVRSSKNPKSCAASLLGDWHRINVALTRAKKKLVMVGSCKTLSKVPLLKLLIEKVEEQSGILSVSNNDIKPKGELKRCSQLIR